MKIYKTFAVILLMIYSLSSEAQSIEFPNASKQPVWTIRFKLERGGFRDEAVRISKDTQICGKTYGILEGGNLDFLYPSRFGFIRTEGKKVWVKKNALCTSKEYLLYDFGMKKGDTTYCLYNIHSPDSDTTKFWVNSIDTIINQGKAIKRLRMGYIFNPPCGTTSNPCITWEVDWLEGIGRIWNPFEFYLCTNWFDCRLDITLVCLQTNNGLQYRDSLNTSCPIATTATNNIENVQIEIIPNPVSSTLLLKSNYQYIGSQVFIIDMMGRIVKKGNLDLTQELNVSDLPNGMYFLKFIVKEQYQIVKFNIVR